jgi:hypothetical protein
MSKSKIVSKDALRARVSVLEGENAALKAAVAAAPHPIVQARLEQLEGQHTDLLTNVAPVSPIAFCAPDGSIHVLSPDEGGVNVLVLGIGAAEILHDSLCVAIDQHDAREADLEERERRQPKTPTFAELIAARVLGGDKHI